MKISNDHSLKRYLAQVFIRVKKKAYVYYFSAITHHFNLQISTKTKIIQSLLMLPLQLSDPVLQP